MEFEPTFGIAFGEGAIAAGKDIIKIVLPTMKNAVINVCKSLSNHIH
jgi:hypothetical protein